VRCGGDRVRVEHDGSQQELRYYNTGKGGEYQLFLLSEAAPIATSGSAAASSAALAGRSLPAPPLILEAESEASRSEQRRQSRRSSPPASVEEMKSEPPLPKDSGAGVWPRYSESRRSSQQAAAAPASVSAASAGEGLASPRYSELRRQSRTTSASPSAAPSGAASGSAPSAAPAARTRYSELRRQSRGIASPPRVAESEAIAASPSQPAGFAVAAGSDVVTKKVAASQAAGRGVGGAPEATAEAGAGGTRTAAPDVEFAPRQNRYSEIRRSSSRGLLSPGPVEGEKLGQREGQAPAPPSEAANACTSGNAASAVENDSSRAVAATEAEVRLRQLESAGATFDGRLRELERALSSGLSALKDDLLDRMEALERRVFARAMEEAEHRFHVAASTAAAVTATAPPPAAITIANSIGGRHGGRDSACDNEEPEEEYEALGDSGDCSAGGGRAVAQVRTQDDISKLPQKKQLQPCVESACSSPRATSEVSTAELADSKLRLEAIGSIARRVSASLGGSSEPQAIDASSKSSTDNLDDEMARLADLRRFASSVLGTVDPGPGSTTSACDRRGDKREQHQVEAFEARSVSRTWSGDGSNAAVAWPSERLSYAEGNESALRDTAHPDGFHASMPSPHFGRDPQFGGDTAHFGAPIQDRRRASSTSSRKQHVGAFAAAWEADTKASGQAWPAAPLQDNAAHFYGGAMAWPSGSQESSTRGASSGNDFGRNVGGRKQGDFPAPPTALLQPPPPPSMQRSCGSGGGEQPPAAPWVSNRRRSAPSPAAAIARGGGVGAQRRASVGVATTQESTPPPAPWSGPADWEEDLDNEGRLIF